MNNCKSHHISSANYTTVKFKEKLHHVIKLGAAQKWAIQLAPQEELDEALFDFNVNCIHINYSWAIE